MRGLRCTVSVIRKSVARTIRRRYNVSSNAAFASNWDLSSARAAAVGNNLHGNGIDGDRLLEVGYGDTRPAEPNTSDESMTMNRRVEIILTPALSAKPR